MADEGGGTVFPLLCPQVQLVCASVPLTTGLALLWCKDLLRTCVGLALVSAAVDEGCGQMALVLWPVKDRTNSVQPYLFGLGGEQEPGISALTAAVAGLWVQS